MFHLINWKVVRIPKDKGGLGIKHLSVMNIAMGAKLLWRLITGISNRWKKILWMKYFKGTKKRCIEAIEENQRGSKIWKLLKSIVPLNRSKLTWIPRNGKDISIWEDDIIGKEALTYNADFLPLKAWLDGENLKYLYDISMWAKRSGQWLG